MELKVTMLALLSLLVPMVMAALSPTTCMSDCGNALAAARHLFGCTRVSSYCECNPHGRTSFVPECLVATCGNYETSAAAYANFLKRCPFSIWWAEQPNLDAWRPLPFYDDVEKRQQLYRLATEGPRGTFEDEAGEDFGVGTFFARDKHLVKKWLTDSNPANTLISATTQTNVHTLTVTPAINAVLSTVTDISAQTYTESLAEIATSVPLSAVSVLSSALASPLSVASKSTTTVYLQSVSATSTSGITSCNSSTLISVSAAPMTTTLPSATVLATASTAQVIAPAASTTSTCSDCSTTLVTVQESSPTATCTTTVTVTAPLVSSIASAASTVAETTTGGAAPGEEISKTGVLMALGVFAYYLHALG